MEQEHHVKIAVYPGSFDPLTNGHLDIIRRASKLFDFLIVGVLNNSAKNPLFTKEERVSMIQKCTGEIEMIEDIPLEDIKHVQTKEVINLRGNVIPLIRLDNLLDVESVENEEESLTVVIVRKGDKQAGLVVDNLIGQQEIVIKSIGNYINCSKMIGGATILGNGEIALILEVNALV